ncbi:MAG: transporter [Alphaproteobacteria bacterium]|nr:transporter [Alphaproteobacteria bacterium]
MAAITPVLGTVLPALSAIGTLVSTAQTLTGNDKQSRQQDLALRQLQERQQLDAAQRAQQTALEREKIALSAEQDEDDRRAALRRAVARQRAQFGASGVSSNGGSSEAVLLGLFDETQGELDQREALDSLKNKALDLSQSQAASLNVLQATQLAQRNKINSLF